MRRRANRGYVSQEVVVAGLGVLPICVIVFLLLMVIWFSVRVGVGTSSEYYGLDGYASLLTDDFVRTVLINTGQFVVVTLLTSAAFGIPAAWLVARTSLPGKGAVLTFITLGVLLPGFLTAMGWVFLLSPQIGMINLLLRQLPGLESVRLSVASAPGMGFVQGLSLTPLFFIMIAPQMLLMDEPLSNLDAQLREEIRQEIRELGRRLHTTIIYVTHDRVEAMALADRVVILDKGRIVQSGGPKETYRRPSTPRIAEFLGSMNWLGGLVTDDPRRSVVQTAMGSLQVLPHTREPADQVLIGMRPGAREAKRRSADGVDAARAQRGPSIGSGGSRGQRARARHGVSDRGGHLRPPSSPGSGDGQR